MSQNQPTQNPDMYDLVKDLLQEIVLEKKIARETAEQKAQRKADPVGSFWGWMKDNGGSVTTLVTVLSAVIAGLWAVNLFVVQQRSQVEQLQREAELRRQTQIAQFASDFADKNKRNSAAYALAVLSGEDALPFLMAQLIEVSRSEEDSSFEAALQQALITIGEPALKEAIDLNRQQSSEYFTSGSTRAISVTQPIILHFLKNDADSLANDKVDLSGISLQGVDLSFRKLDKLLLNGTRISNSSLCQAEFNGTHLEKANLNEVQLSGSSFDGAQLSEANFSYADMEGANLSHVSGSKVRFFASNLSRADLTEANFVGADFSGLRLRGARLDSTDLNSANFDESDLTDAALVRADLKSASMLGTALYGADLSNADLEGTRLFFNETDTPKIPEDLVSQGMSAPKGFGAFVKDTNFAGAKNLNDGMRKYLCRWGAKEVPGGCADTAPESMPYLFLGGGGGGGGSCF